MSQETAVTRVKEKLFNNAIECCLTNMRVLLLLNAIVRLVKQFQIMCIFLKVMFKEIFLKYLKETIDI